MNIYPSSLGPSKHYIYKIHEMDINRKNEFIVCTDKHDERSI